MSAGAAGGETFMPSSMEYSEGDALSVFPGGLVSSLLRCSSTDSTRVELDVLVSCEPKFNMGFFNCHGWLVVLRKD